MVAQNSVAYNNDYLILLKHLQISWSLASPGGAQLDLTPSCVLDPCLLHTSLILLLPVDYSRHVLSPQ